MGKGTENLFTLSGGFNITGQQPIDSRLVVKNVSDLYLVDTWDGVGLYNGLVVAIQSTGSLFVLKDRDNYTDAASWVAVGGDVSADLSALTARVGVVEGKINVAADSGLDATSALKVKIDNTVSGNILQVSENGLSVVASQSEYSLDAVSEPSAGYAAQYQFKKDGAVQTTINIPKDQFLKSATFHSEKEDDATVDAPYLKFVWQLDVDSETDGDQTVTYVPVADLVDTYTSGEGISIENNVINLDVDAAKIALGINGLPTTLENLQNQANTNTSGVADLNQSYSVLNTSVGNLTKTVGENSAAIESLETTVGTHTTDISGLKASVEAIKIVDVYGRDSQYGIRLVKVDSNGDQSNPDGNLVDIAVNIDELASEIISRHEISVPNSADIKLSAEVGSLSKENTVQEALVNLDSRIKAAVSGGVTGIAAGAGITVDSTDVNNPSVSVKTSDIVEPGSALVVSNNKIDLTWTEL